MFGNSITKFLKLDTLIANLTGYVEAKVELVKVEAKKEVAAGTSRAITYLLIAFVFGMVLFFLSFGIAIVLSDVLGKFAGYGIIALVYLITGLILVARRERIIKAFEKQISQPSKKKK
jgi:hypothetical protein